MTALRFEAVVKRYTRRSPPALDALSFEVPEGAIAGVVGPNGAGKTTAFAVLSGFVRPDSGQVSVLGREPFHPAEHKGRVGVLPQDAELPDRHTPTELLAHLGRLQGMRPTAARAEAARLVEFVGLVDRAQARIHTLSHGMRRRVAVATALVGDPQVVVLDEPLAGLDPVQASALRDRLAAIRGARTLVVSSHNLAEVERLCDWIVMMRAGRCVRAGPTAEVTGATEWTLWELGPGEVPLATLREALPDAAVAIEGHRLSVRVGASRMDEASLLIAAELVKAQVPIRGMSRGVGLERRFLDDHAG